MKRRVAVAALAILLAVFAYAFQWRYDQLPHRLPTGEQQTLLLRTNRFTSEVQVFDARTGWTKKGPSDPDLDRVVDELLAKQH